MLSQNRISRSETIDELQRQLKRLFPQAEVVPLEGKNFGRAILTGDNSCEIDVNISDDGNHISGCRVITNRRLDEHELRFARFFGKVFNDDLRSAPLWGKDQELWLSLQQTRLVRVIARFSPFHTPIFLKWLRTFENAVSLRYEGQPFSMQLVLTKQMEWIRNNSDVSFVRFPERMSFTSALFEEKWTRSLAAGEELTLVGLGHDKGIVGVMYANPTTQSVGQLIAPHSDLINFCSVLVPGTLGLLASQQGDLRILMPSGATFLKSQGHWTIVNLRLLQDTLSVMMDKSIAHCVMRLVADLSYDGQGGLLCFLEDPKLITQIVPDHSNKSRVGRSLRLMSRKLSVMEPGHQKILKRVAAIDGAVVFSSDGRILDAACMVSDPSDAKLAEFAIKERRRFSGARSTAAWNASFYGIAIKVSEDGPITVFRRGDQILQI